MPDTPERRPADIAPPASRATQPTIHSNRPEGSASASNSGGSGSGASQKAREKGEQAKQKAEQTGEQVKQKTSRLADEAKQRGRQLLEEQKGNAAQQLSGIAQALHQSADQCMSSSDQRTAGRVLEQAASALDRLSESLRNRDVDSMLDQANTLMRRQPTLVIAGTLAAGFLLSRFALSSSHHSRQSYGDSDDYDRASQSYVTSAHADPGEVADGRRATPPVMPTGRRDY